MLRQLTILAIFFCSVFLTGVVAKAQHPCCSGYRGYSGYAWGRYARDQAPPYFALHPPVYYSDPVPRTYGYSPFAYPPGTRTPEVQTFEPGSIKKLFIPKSEMPKMLKKTGDRVTQAPIHIEGGAGKTFFLKPVARFDLSSGE